eukprot:gene23972-9547_t
MSTSVLLATLVLAISLQLGEFRVLEHPSTVPYSFEHDDGQVYIKGNDAHWRVIASDVQPEYSFYFFHNKTGNAQWTDPRFPEDHDRTDVEVTDGKLLNVKMVYKFDDNATVYKTRVVLSETVIDMEKSNVLLNQPSEEGAVPPPKTDGKGTTKTKGKTKGAKGGATRGLTKTTVVIFPILLFLALSYGKGTTKTKGKTKGAKGEATSGLTKTIVVVLPILLFLAGIFGRIYYLHTYYPELLFPTKTRKVRRAKQAKLKAQKARGKMSQDGKGGSSAGG